MKSILLVEDDISFSQLLQRFLERNGYKVTTILSVKEALRTIEVESFHMVFSDLRLPDGDGIDLLKSIRSNGLEVPVILMTGYAEVSTAVEAMKQGAFDYISKPFNQEEVLDVIANALKSSSKSSSKTEVNISKKGFNQGYVKGVSKSSQTLNEYVQLVGPTNMSVLIIGESGTGKEMVAKAIHEQSSRNNKPFVAVDCGAIPKEIASSEFFGHVKGAFTGAIDDKKGHFLSANEGTLFLDEVGNLSYENQIQLLRALQERKIKPVGSSKEISVDIRIIAATNENLEKAVDNGDFRNDLYHRLNEFSIKMPQLSERREDIPIFAEYFLELANKQLDKQVLGFTPETMAVFQKYNWPGNLRELSNVIKRATLLTQGGYIQSAILQTMLSVKENVVDSEINFSTKHHEKELIRKALIEAENNKTLAAKLLNITRKTLYNKLKEYNIE